MAEMKENNQTEIYEIKKKKSHKKLIIGVCVILLLGLAYWGISSYIANAIAEAQETMEMENQEIPFSPQTPQTFEDSYKESQKKNEEFQKEFEKHKAQIEAKAKEIEKKVEEHKKEAVDVKEKTEKVKEDIKASEDAKELITANMFGVLDSLEDSTQEIEEENE